MVVKKDSHSLLKTQRRQGVGRRRFRRRKQLDDAHPQPGDKQRRSRHRGGRWRERRWRESGARQRRSAPVHEHRVRLDGWDACQSEILRGRCRRRTWRWCGGASRRSRGRSRSGLPSFAPDIVLCAFPGWPGPSDSRSRRDAGAHGRVDRKLRRLRAGAPRDPRGEDRLLLLAGPSGGSKARACRSDAIAAIYWDFRNGQIAETRTS